MEKIIAAIRTLNDNLVAFKKETALEEANVHQRLDGMLDVTDGLRADLDALVERIADYDNQFDVLKAQTKQYESALANLTQRIFALEKTPTAAQGSGDDIGDALDDILKDAEETEAGDMGDIPKDVEAGIPKDVEAGDMDGVLKDAMDGVLKDVNDAMDGVLKDVENKLASNTPIDVDAFIAAHAPAKTTPAKTTTARAKATKKTASSVAMTAVQKRAFARQYMVEVMNAKVEDLRSPAKIEETMASTEFETWLSAR